MTYRVICADPPWSFHTAGNLSPDHTARSVNRHYSTMSLDAIKALPVADLAAKDCALFLWITDTHLPEGLDVLQGWGFKYVTVGFHWVKTNAKSGSYFTGCGWWTRANPELCLMGTKGRPIRMARDVKRLIVAPRREHSRKPDEAYESIMRLVDGPYVECFARTRRPGWDQAFSNQEDLFE